MKFLDSNMRQKLIVDCVHILGTLSTLGAHILLDRTFGLHVGPKLKDWCLTLL